MQIPRNTHSPFPLLTLLAVFLLSAASADAGFRNARIAGGNTTGAYPEVGAIVSNTHIPGEDVGAVSADDMAHECTATLIGCKTVLTAAHCAPVEDISRYKLFFPNAGFFDTTEISIHPDYASFANLDADIAIFHLATEVPGIQPATLISEDPYGHISESQNPEGVIVGYGQTDYDSDDSGIKRSGTVALEPCEPGIDIGYNEDVLCFTFEVDEEGEPVNPAPAAGPRQGDSGGPLFMALNDETVLAGVTTSSYPGEQIVYVSAYHFLDFIQEKLGDDSTSVCGDGPEVGGDSVSVVTIDDAVDDGNAEQSYEFETTSDADHLTFTMNGEATESFNVDLFIKQNGEVSSENHDCAQTGARPYGSCDFTSVQAGDTWNALVRRDSGSGNFQLQATAYGAAPPALFIVTETFEVPEGKPYLYYLNYESGSSGTVERFPLDDPSAVEELVQIPEYQHKIHGIAADVDRDRIYYTTTHGSPNESSVWQASLKGEDPEQLYLMVQASDPDPPKGFGSIEALGSDDGDLVWVDIGGRRIWLGNAQGDAPTYYDFEEEDEWLYIGNLYGLAVDRQNQVALISDWEYSRIYQVTPGGGITLWMDEDTPGFEFANPSFYRPQTMAIDNVNRTLYWVQGDGLWRTPLDDRLNDEHLYEFGGASGMGGLALDLQNEVVYWSENNYREINRANMDGSSEAPEEVVKFPSLHSAHGMTIAYIPAPEPGAGLSALAAMLCLGLLRRKRPA